MNDLGVVPNLGDLFRFLAVYQRVQARKGINLLTLGGSITAGGYFMEFVRALNADGLNATYHNHGHGATDITYTIYCIDIERYSPDLVLIDFSVNDNGHPKQMDGLIRKALALPSQPIVLLVNLWVTKHCPQPRYMLHAHYYQLPLLNLCPAVDLCFGKAHLPKAVSDLYSKTDGVHPWGPKGVKFLGDMLFAWWKRLERITTQDVQMDTAGKTIVHKHSFDHILQQRAVHNDKAAVLPPPLYVNNPIGLCTRCDALADDADGKLLPVHMQGFKVATRVKVGFGGFKQDKSQATKSMRKSWLADTPGSEISFRFYGSTVGVAIWQRRDGMGVLHAHIDDNKAQIAKASGFFRGYTWAMEKNNTGRSEIVTLFEGLTDTAHTITLRVSDEPANPFVVGHLVQIFALLSASDDMKCKSKLTAPAAQAVAGGELPSGRSNRHKHSRQT